ncbi:oxidoreductase, partial [Enterobacter hormaechei subsp. steigerwaltii]|nr:oxidoreductase [Enterobacter hormaechei subsp. steigerwaltii]
RTLRHPDGVILDIGTHVLAMLRETVRYLGGSDDMTLQVVTAKDRLGREIATGDLTTAEGEAHLQGSISGVPVDIWLNKYAGPAGGQKGLRFHLRDGRIVSHDRRGAEDVLELIKGKEIQRWHIPGTIYEHCLAEHILGAKSLFERDPHQVSRTTRRRVEEVTLLLTLQQQLRGPH